MPRAPSQPAILNALVPSSPPPGGRARPVDEALPVARDLVQLEPALGQHGARPLALRPGGREGVVLAESGEEGAVAERPGHSAQRSGVISSMSAGRRPPETPKRIAVPFSTLVRGQSHQAPGRSWRPAGPQGRAVRLHTPTRSPTRGCLASFIRPSREPAAGHLSPAATAQPPRRAPPRPTPPRRWEARSAAPAPTSVQIAGDRVCRGRTTVVYQPRLAGRDQD